MTSRKVVIIPARAAYEVTRCFDCPYFKEYGAPYQDGNTCQHDSVDYPIVTGFGIPDWCPELKEIPDEPVVKSHGYLDKSKEQS